MNDVEQIIAETEREIMRRKIRKPGPGEFVAECQWSKTGWAVWKRGGGCTCDPARKPRHHRNAAEEK